MFYKKLINTQKQAEAMSKPPPVVTCLQSTQQLQKTSDYSIRICEGIMWSANRKFGQSEMNIITKHFKKKTEFDLKNRGAG